MKASLLLFVVLAADSSMGAESTKMEDFSPHLATTAQIVWKVPSNEVPKSLWIYKKLPRVFSAATISNAVILAGFQHKGFPKPSTNATVIWDEIAGSTIGEPRPPCFAIMPEDGVIQYDLGDRWPDSPKDILTGQTEIEYAWSCLTLLGVDRAEFVKTNVENVGVSFPRQIDGIRFPDGTEGFGLQRYGKERKLRLFMLSLPKLQRTTNSPTASPNEIIACIRAFKTVLMPNGEEGANYFSRLKVMANAKKLTITKLTPYYGEGVYGEEPPNNRRPSWVMPVAYLEATATLGTSNVAVRLYSPILSSDVVRLLKDNRK